MTYTYRYWIPDHGETIEDAHTIEMLWQDGSDAAADAADYDHNNRSGYEYSWPIDYCVQLVTPEGEPPAPIERFEIERDFNPVFSVALVPRVPSPLKHSVTDTDDCTNYCAACRENIRRGFNPDGTEKGPEHV